MRRFAPWTPGLLPALVWAQPVPPPPIPVEDPLLASLIQEALDRNPTLARASALARAEEERVPQARALPDPSLTLGLQNDGFRKLMVGMMESSYYQVMLTQPLPWPGKRGLRGEIAKVGVELAQTELKRGTTTLTADVKRAYFGLLLARGQQSLLEQQAGFWQKAAEITKVRYEVGQGTQADLLRAQLEQNRLKQARLTLRAEEHGFLTTLNRLRGLEANTPLATPRPLDAIPVPFLPVSTWIERAEMDCCELQDARLYLKQTEQSLALAKRDRMPDFAVTAGVMPRGSFEPMWQVGVSISLPIWSGQKQKRSITEQEWRRKGNEAELTNVQNLVKQRIFERNAQLEALRETLALYREGLLVQSEASFQASLGQYEAGRGSFLGVMESLNGWAADRSGYLQTLAQAQAVAIAQEEFNLNGTPSIAAQGLGSSSMGMGGSPSGAMSSPTPKPGAAAPEGGPAMKAM